MPSSPCGRPATTPRRRGRWASACSTMPRSPRAMRRSSMALDRVAIVDFDVHHGNGSQEIFWSDATRDVLLDPPDAALSRHRRDVRARRAQQYRQCAAARRRRRREIPRSVRDRDPAAAACVQARSSSSSRPASMPTSATRSPTSIWSKRISPGRRRRSWTLPTISRGPRGVGAGGRLRPAGPGAVGRRPRHRADEGELALLARGQAAIDRIIRAGDEAGGIRQQVPRERGDFLCPAKPADRNIRGEFLPRLRRILALAIV